MEVQARDAYPETQSRNTVICGLKNSADACHNLELRHEMKVPTEIF